MSRREREIVSQLTNDAIGWYVDFYRRFDHLIGQEVTSTRHDHLLWDSTLTVMMPDRPAWGFSNDDMHSMSQLGRKWNEFVLPELSQEWVRQGMTEGRFFFVYAPGGHEGASPPDIDSIKVDRSIGTIHVHASNYDSVQWISNGTVVHEGNPINLVDVPEADCYVRAVLYGDGETHTGTQPFGITRP
jgi:hypothetical protein